MDAERRAARPLLRRRDRRRGLRVCEQIDESLYAYEIGGTAADPGPGRRSATPNADSPTWTCTLRDGVKFHDGATLDANDVVVSYAVQWDAEHPLHNGRDRRRSTYWPGLFGGFLNPPAAVDPSATANRHRRGRRIRGAPRVVIAAAAPVRGDRQPMTQFIIRRLLVTIPVLLGIVFIVFALARLVPGDPVPGRPRRAGDRRSRAPTSSTATASTSRSPSSSSPTSAAARRAATSGSRSSSAGRSPTLLIERLPDDGRADHLALIFAIVVGIPLGLISAYRRNSTADVGHDGLRQPRRLDAGLRPRAAARVPVRRHPQGHAVRAAALGPAERRASSVIPLATSGASRTWTGPPRGILDFVSGIYTFNALITGHWGALGDAFRHLILPAIALGTIPLAIIARMTRSSLLEVLGLDYVRTARAKGLERAQRGPPPRRCATPCCRS